MNTLVALLASPVLRFARLVSTAVGGDVGFTASGHRAPSLRRTSARHRGGRLPLPPSVVLFTDADARRFALVNEFVDQLAELPLAKWLQIGGAVAADQVTLARRSTAWAILDATIADRRLGVAAWYVRDGIETAAYLASHSWRRLSRSERRLFAAACGAAEEAALSLLARPHLAVADFETLCTPFAILLESDRARGGVFPREG